MSELKELIKKCKEDLDSALNENERNTRRVLVHAVFDELSELAEKHSSSSGDAAPVVDLGDKFDFAESRYKRGNKGWFASSLYKKAEEDGLKPFDVPLASLDLSVMPFKVCNFDDFIWHMRRCSNADTNIPILLDDLGQIADGNHRVARAILRGKKYIKAYRLKNMPPVDFTDNEE